MKKLELNIGQTFGNFTYLGEEDNELIRKALFRCACGFEKRVSIIKVTSGNTKTCGRKECDFFQRGRAPNPNISTEVSKGSKRKVTSEYKTYYQIKSRCYNPNNKAYFNYGGRGINMCPTWLNSFDTFIADMGKRPDNCDSIDRINNDKGYTKENCRWATTEQQSRNKRNNSYVFYKGERMCLVDAMSKADYFNHSLYDVYDKNPAIKDFEELMAIAKNREAKRHAELNLINLYGQKVSLRQASEFYNVPFQSVYEQLKKGKSVEDSIAYLMSPVRRRNNPYYRLK